MIDFIKCRVLDCDCQALAEHPLLDFTQGFVNKTGEIMNNATAHYKALEFRIFKPNTLIIKGSLHKYNNQGMHNYNDFSIKELESVLLELDWLFCITPDRYILQNLEFGVNINPPIATHSILRNIILHKRKEFKNIDIQGGFYKQARYQHYFLKAYDKALQYKLNDNIFRWEMKFRRMNYFDKIGIKTLMDLIDEKKYKSLGKLLTEMWEEVLFLDPTIKFNKLNPLEKRQLDTRKNPNYWYDMIDQPPSNRNKFSKEINNFKRLIVDNSENVHQQIKNLIDQKWKTLTDQ